MKRILLIAFCVFAIIGIIMSITAGCGGNKIEFVQGKPVLIFKDGVVAPVVALSKYFMTRNSATTQYVNFRSGQNLQVINILFDDNNSTVLDTATIDLMGGLDFTTKRGDSLILTNVDGIWQETYRKLSEEI